MSEKNKTRRRGKRYRRVANIHMNELAALIALREALRALRDVLYKT